MQVKWAYAALLALALTAGNAAVPAAQVQTLPDFAAIVEANKAAVVNIMSAASAYRSRRIRRARAWARASSSSLMA
jgi:hypothetical protein